MQPSRFSWLCRTVSFVQTAAPARSRSCNDLRGRRALPPQPDLGDLNFVYLFAGAPQRALDIYERYGEAGFNLSGSLFWHSSFAPVRKTERFRAFVRKHGLVDYWRARGWPDLCH